MSALGMGAVRAAGAAPARAALLAELLAWLNHRFAPDGPPIRAETPLFAGGLLDSMRILELIAWTERAIGREIPDVAIRTDNFATPARIAELFAREDSHAYR
jgi:acyl carrier protein